MRVSAFSNKTATANQILPQACERSSEERYIIILLQTLPNS